MNGKNLALVIALSVMSVSSVSAQGDFFFSFTQGGVNADKSANYEVGDTGSIWIYWSTNGPADSDLSVGAGLDIMTSTSGIIEFTAAETFDYDITKSGNVVDTRLLLGGYGQTGSVTADFIDELFAFTTPWNHSNRGND